MASKLDGFVCRNKNCPIGLQSKCKRYGAEGKVKVYVPERNHFDSDRLFCDGFAAKEGGS